MTKREIEVFTSGCASCEEAMRLIREMVCPDCRVTEYNIKIQSAACMEKAVAYGIKSTPTIVVDGKVVCVGKPNRDQLAAAGIGKPL